MKQRFVANCRKFALAMVLLISVLFGCPACRTFNTTPQEFSRQQQGHYPQTSTDGTVEFAGFLLEFFGPWLACH